MSATRRKRNEMWLQFTAKEDDKAICDHCKHELSLKTTTSNLRKHFERNIQLLVHKRQDILSECQVQAASQTHQSKRKLQIQPHELITREFIKNYNRETNVIVFVYCSSSFARQKRLNNMLLKIIIKDMQPFFIVEDQGFQDFISAIDPSYKLPNRKMITRELLVDSYRDTVQKITAVMESVQSVCLTIDSWTSVTPENYLAVTAHFLNQDFQLESCLLDCSNFRERHAQENLKQELIRITKEWKIEDKVVPVLMVTDNAANIVNAVKMAKFKHLPCFVHTLNFVLFIFLFYS